MEDNSGNITNLPVDKLDSAPFEGVPLTSIFDLPKDRLFKDALRNLKLPKIICGQDYECVVKLFHINNQFDKIYQIDHIECKRDDFVVKLDPEKRMLHIKGTPQNSEEVKIHFYYSYIQKSLFTQRSKETFQDCLLKLDVAPDPVIEWSKILEDKKMQLDPTPEKGQVGKMFFADLDLLHGFDQGIKDRIHFESITVQPECGLKCEISENGLSISGTPIQPGNIDLEINYEIIPFSSETEKKTCTIPFTQILPDIAYQYEEEFKNNCKNYLPIRKQAGAGTVIRVDFNPLFDGQYIDIVDVSLSLNDEHLESFYDKENNLLIGEFVPASQGDIYAKIHYYVITFVGRIEKECDMVICKVTPDPKTLWKVLKTDPNAPYQTLDTAINITQVGERTIIAASKRGRSHAHEGKFRDDNFAVEYLPETGWSIVVVSDGAGSAKYSRAGSKIACDTFTAILKERLSSEDDNKKIDGISEEGSIYARNLVLSAAYQCLVKIDEEAKKQQCLRKDYNATFLAYIMKQFDDHLFITSIGIGDGVIALLNKDRVPQLLSDPDGGEYVGQTRFITMNEVWHDQPINRTHSFNIKTSDFDMLFSMTDGVSDPFFETDNNLRKEQPWHDFYAEIASNTIS